MKIQSFLTDPVACGGSAHALTPALRLRILAWEAVARQRNMRGYVTRSVSQRAHDWSGDWAGGFQPWLPVRLRVRSEVMTGWGTNETDTGSPGDARRHPDPPALADNRSGDE